MKEDKLKKVGDEFEEEEQVEIKEGETQLYDLILPPGVPHKIIIEAIDKFGLEVSKREIPLKTIDIEKENLLALRGEKETLYKAQDYIYERMSKLFNYKR